MAQEAFTFDTGRSKRGRLNYLLFLPSGYGGDPGKKWPLILFLHGGGERGDDLEMVKRHGIPKLVETRKRFRFIVVSPQCPAGATWPTYLHTLNSLLDEVTANYAVDTDRFYLTGMSMGGYGTWHLAAQYPERFAAIAPICGGGLKSYGFPEKARALKDALIWAFHGALDKIVPVEEAQRIVDVVRSCGGKVRFTIYPDVGHDSWTVTYRDPRLYRWFLRHSRSTNAQ